MSDEVKETSDNDEEESPLEANEPIKCSADLQQEKQRITQDYYAQGNIGATQVFINSLGSMNWGGQQMKSITTPQSKQTYKLYTREGCAAFVEQYRNSEYLAVAIVLSTFEMVRLSDLPELKALLMLELPDDGPTGEDNELTNQNPYISVDTFLSTIGGKWFTNPDGQQCVGLGEHSQQALSIFWEQFPALRAPVCKWLVHLCQVYQFRTTFDAYQIVCAFSRVISMDFEDAQKQIFSRLYSSSNNAGLLGNIMCKLFENTSLQIEIEHMLLNWLQSESAWLWQPACLTCAFLMPKLDQKKFGPLLEKALKHRLNHLNRNDSIFLSVLLIQSEYFRTMLIDLLSKTIRHRKTQSSRLIIAQAYLYLLRSCYYLVNADCQALPLIACDTKQQQQLLTPILQEVISHSILRKQMYAVLRAYLSELSRYHYSNSLYNHLCASFYNMAQSSPDYRQDILQFLSGCRGKLSALILERLHSIYDPIRQIPVNSQP